MSYFYFQRQFNDKTPYTIMFGPDKCGMDHKVIVMKIILTTNKIIFVKYQCMFPVCEISDRPINNIYVKSS